MKKIIDEFTDLKVSRQHKHILRKERDRREKRSKEFDAAIERRKQRNKIINNRIYGYIDRIESEKIPPEKIDVVYILKKIVEDYDN